MDFCMLTLCAAARTKLPVNFITLYTIMLSRNDDHFLFFCNSYTFYFSCLKARIPVVLNESTDSGPLSHLSGNSYCSAVGVCFKDACKIKEAFFIPSCEEFLF